MAISQFLRLQLYFSRTDVSHAHTHMCHVSNRMRKRRQAHPRIGAAQAHSAAHHLNKRVQAFAEAVLSAARARRSTNSQIAALHAGQHKLMAMYGQFHVYASDSLRARASLVRPRPAQLRKHAARACRRAGELQLEQLCRHDQRLT
jgi:hypothetical protein